MVRQVFIRRDNIELHVVVTTTQASAAECSSVGTQNSQRIASLPCFPCSSQELRVRACSPSGLQRSPAVSARGEDGLCSERNSSVCSRGCVLTMLEWARGCASRSAFQCLGLAVGVINRWTVYLCVKAEILDFLSSVFTRNSSEKRSPN